VLTYIRKQKLKEIESNRLLCLMGDLPTLHALNSNNNSNNNNKTISYKRKRGTSKSSLITEELESSVTSLCSAIGPR
jgi:hypothetical protein